MSLDCEAATEYGEILARSKTIGRKVTVADAQIAAITAVLATRNVKDFEWMAELSVVDPWR